MKFHELKVLPRILTLLHSERPKLYAILAVLSAIGLNIISSLCVRNRNASYTAMSILTEESLLLGFMTKRKMSISQQLPFMSCNIPYAPAYAVYVSKLVMF